MCVCSAEAYILCGDDKGRLWTYMIDMQKIGRGGPAERLQPTEVQKASSPPPQHTHTWGRLARRSGSEAADPELLLLLTVLLPAFRCLSGPVPSGRASVP